MHLDRIEEMIRWSQSARAEGRSLGFVPTMGALHEAHQSLIRRAREENDRVVVSVFVNPLQFGPKEDYQRYPRDLEGDAHKIQQAGGDVVFTATAEQFYPPGFSSYVVPEGLALQLEGQLRPGHFRGVATVVLKLFQIVRPTRAYFGRKDAQQLAVIENKVRDLCLDVQIIPCELIREPDGLAMSSRNAFLSAQERANALNLSRSLFAAQKFFSQGERNAQKILDRAWTILKAAPGLQVEYLSLVDPQSWHECRGEIERGLLLIAARVGNTRLIDNIFLSEPLQ